MKNTVIDTASVNALFSGLDRQEGLVKSASILQRGAEYDIGVFQRIINVSLTGTMRCCRYGCSPAHDP